MGTSHTVWLSIKSPLYTYTRSTKEQMLCHKIRINELKSCCIFYSFYLFIWGGSCLCVLCPSDFFHPSLLVLICFLDFGLSGTKVNTGSIFIFSISSVYIILRHVLASVLVQASGSISLIPNDLRSWYDNPTIPSETKNIILPFVYLKLLWFLHVSNM